MENELTHPSSNVRLETFVWSEFLAEYGKWLLYLLKNENFEKSNSFEADFRHAEVTDM